MVRLEQLYPFPEQELAGVLRQWPNMREVVWCQEEPMNQGAWYSSQHHMRNVLAGLPGGIELAYAGREAFAAPAGGYMARHIERQQALVQDALTGSNGA